MCRKNAISDVHPQVTEIMQKGKKKKVIFCHGCVTPYDAKHYTGCPRISSFHNS